MRIFIDQMQRRIEVPDFPKRIISLVPSQTELLFDLGLDQEIIGITKFCVHPHEKFKNSTKIGGTKSFNFELIEQLKPDLIIANKEENYQAGIEQLTQKYPVWLSDIFRFEDALEMIHQVGALINKIEKSQSIVNQINTRFSNLRTPQTKLKVAYFIWHNPLMVAGKNTFIHEMLEKAGFENIFAHYTRYPIITYQELQASQANLLLLSSEPFPFKIKHLHEMKSVCPSTQVLLVDGEMFSWYGTRLLQTPHYIEKLWQNIIF